MTRKDYILIAQVIKDINQRKATGERIAQLFSDMLKRDNTAFDRAKFLKACGVVEEKDAFDTALRCTHRDCQELQTADGEFCDKHYPA